MITHCPNGHRVDVPSSRLGLETICPTCSQSFVVSEAASGEAIPGSDGGERAPGVAGRRAHAASNRWADRLNLDVLETLRPVAQLLLLIGLLLALSGRGWDSIGDRNASSADARVQHAITDWEDDWEDRLDRITEEEDTLRAEEDLTAADRERLEALRAERQNVLDEREIDRSKHVDQWNDLERSARETRSENKIMKPFREAVFFIGTILLALGLLAAGFTTEGPARWFCLALLAIILVGLYFGNVDLLPADRVMGTTSME